MNCCSDLFFLSTLACKLSKCLDEKELAILAADLVALGEMIEAVLARQETCQKE